MGIFFNQQYNEQMPMYVDPKLEVLANSLGALQKRHDENYAAMSAFDIMANNIRVAEGDTALKTEALAKLKGQRDAIAASGDYALATPRIGMAVKDFSTNQNLTMAQENMKAIDEAQKLAQQYGASALDFNPAANWSTVDPATGQARRYVGGIEQRKDWDTRMQEVSKVMADSRPLGLTSADVDGYLRTGSITGISQDKVDAYLGKAYSRFMNTEEGDQMYRKLTKIDGLDPMDAKRTILRSINNVSDAQVHTKVDHNYQVDSWRMNKENQAHDDAMTREGWDREDGRARAKMAADLAKEAMKQKGKLDAAGNPALPSKASERVFEATRPGGTTWTNEDLMRFFPGLTTKIKTDNGEVTGVMIPGTKHIALTKLVPEADKVPADILAKGRSYYSSVKELDSKLTALKAEKARLLNPNDNDLDALRSLGNVVNVTGDKSSDPFPTNTLQERQKRAAELDREIALAQRSKNKIVIGNKDNLEAYKKYEPILTGKKSNDIVELGKSLENLNLPSIANVSKKNAKAVEGNVNLDVISYAKASQLVTLGEEKFNMLKESGAINTDIEFDDLVIKSKKTDLDEKLYEIQNSVEVPLSTGIMGEFNRDYYKGQKAYTDNIDALDRQDSEFLADQPRRNAIYRDAKDTGGNRKYLRNASLQVIDMMDIDDTEALKMKQELSKEFSNFNSLSPERQTALIDKAEALVRLAQQNGIE